jgi:UDP-glucose 4-epimerase
LGNINILDLCVKYKIKKYIYASTVYVYGNVGGFYSISKKCSEQIIQEYYRRYNLKYTIIRFGSIYGPGARAGNAIFDIIKMALSKKQIKYWGSGQERREYIHVNDAALACVKSLDKKFDNKNLMISGMQSMKINDLLIMIREIFKNKIKIYYKKNNRSRWHYKITPYEIEEDECIKVIPDSYIDLGKGIINYINYLKKK